MTDRTHKFKVGQSVDLIPSTFRSAARGNYEIVSLRPADSGSPQYRIKSKSESHERVVAETDLILSSRLNLEFDGKQRHRLAPAPARPTAPDGSR
jgi:hypothetical protein